MGMGPPSLFPLSWRCASRDMLDPLTALRRHGPSGTEAFLTASSSKVDARYGR